MAQHTQFAAKFGLVKFLCGRPGCGKNSTATLQIDAPSSTVSLIDPRISRDGVPLCDRHADLTTPPMGWSMNDMRSQQQLSAVPTGDDIPTRVPKVPPRSRSNESSKEQQDSGSSKKQKVAKRVKKKNSDQDKLVAKANVAKEDSRFEDSRPSVNQVLEERRSKKRKEGLSNRPAKRREVLSEDVKEADKFPWHHQFDDDEPEELHADSPLLSRAFRSSVG